MKLSRGSGDVLLNKTSTRGTVFGSFISTLEQRPTANPNASTVPVAITYTDRVSGTILLVDSTKIRIPVDGTYRVLFSAECDSTGGTHWIEIWPVVNGISVPNSNTRVEIPATTQSCLTVEYLLPLSKDDDLELYMRAENFNTFLAVFPEDLTTTPITPAVPSIITNVMLIQ
jgi:hypothetical protein